MKKVLITGASGFIGSYLKEHLSGYEVSTLSLRDPNWKDQPIDADVVIHCAGLAHSKKSLPKERYMEINCHLTRELLEHSSKNKVSHFIYLSSMLVYGEGDLGAIGPDSKTNPMSVYAASKLCGENLLDSISNFRVSIIRLPLVFSENPKGNLRAIKRFAALSPIFVKYNNKKSIIILNEIPDLIKKIIENKGRIVVTPQSKVISTTDIYLYYRKLLNKPSVLIPLKSIINTLKLFKIVKKIFGDQYYIEEKPSEAN